MIILFSILAAVGAVVAVVAAFGIFALGVTAFRDWRHEPHQRSHYEGFKDALNRLGNDSWWFSESPETMQLLADLSRGVDVSQAREKWRKARESTEVIGRP